MGDVSSTTNSKTAAAVRKQAPVVVDNILHMMGKTAVEAGYDGYASCPLTTAFGKAILAEFIYGGKGTPPPPPQPPPGDWGGWWGKKGRPPVVCSYYIFLGEVPVPSHKTALTGEL